MAVRLPRRARFEADIPIIQWRDMVQWGQLATASDRQGEGIARAMGALAILEAAQRLSARRFRTGINPNNSASARLCTSLGVRDSEYVIVAAMDPEAFSDEHVTK